MFIVGFHSQALHRSIRFPGAYRANALGSPHARSGTSPVAITLFLKECFRVPGSVTMAGLTGWLRKYLLLVLCHPQAHAFSLSGDVGKASNDSQYDSFYVKEDREVAKG